MAVMLNMAGQQRGLSFIRTAGVLFILYNQPIAHAVSHFHSGTLVATFLSGMSLNVPPDRVNSSDERTQI